MKVFVYILSAIFGAIIFAGGLSIDDPTMEIFGLALMAPCAFSLMSGGNRNTKSNSCTKNADDYLNNYASLDWWENSKKHPTDLLENESHKKSR